MHYPSFLSLIVSLASIFGLNASIVQYPPLWVTRNQNLFNVLTGSGVLNTYSFTFSSNLSGVPNLGYGIKAYEGNDYFGQERFQVNKIALDQSSFTVTVELIGATNLYILNVPYIAIDPLFPHHINSFDNVPVNYSAGPLVNVSVKNYVSLETYRNVINYTQQAASTNHRYFSEPLSNNKVLLFMTCMYITGMNQATTALPSAFNPLTLHVYTQVLTNDTYLISVTLGIKINLERLQYSMVIFDQEDVESSLKYFLVYERIDIGNQGGFIPMPIQFIDNFIMGFTNFSSYRTLVAITFEWKFANESGIHGVKLDPFVGKSPVGTVVSTIGFTLFYMKTWICPNNTFINHTLNLCQECFIQGCAQCLSLKVCGTCDASNHYKLLGKQCVRCDVDNNYFLNPDTNQCELCPVQFCPLPRVQKDACNTMVIKIGITKQLPINCTMEQIFITNPQIQKIHAEIVQNGKMLKIYATYGRDIEINQIVTVYLGARDRRRVACDPSVLQMYYSPDQCQTEDLITRMAQGIEILNYVMLFISIMSCKIVGLELFGVLQLAYFALGSYDYIDLYLAPISLLKSTNGYNLQSLVLDGKTTKILSYLGIHSSFLNNLNIMGALIWVFTIVMGILLLISKLTLNRVMQNRVKSVYKQGCITLVMFNTYNIAYSTGVHVNYGHIQGQDGEFVFSTVFMALTLGLCVGIVGVLEAGDVEQYGEFKNKFKSTLVCLIYIPLSLVYRVATALYLALQIQYKESTLLILGVSLAFNMYFIINLPFSDWYQNYRSGLIHLTQLIILLTANYYRSMKSNTPLKIKAKQHTFALIQLVLILLCILVSGVLLAVEVGHWVRKLCHRRRSRKVEEERRQTEASMADFHNEIPTELKN